MPDGLIKHSDTRRPPTSLLLTGPFVRIRSIFMFTMQRYNIPENRWHSLALFWHSLVYKIVFLIFASSDFLIALYIVNNYFSY